ALLALLSQLSEDPVTLLSATADRAAARPGDVVRVSLTVAVAEHFHLYATTSKITPVAVKIQTPDVQLDGKLEEPEPKIVDFFGEKYPAHEGEVTLVARCRIGRVPDGPLEIRGTLVGQACDDKVCKNVEVAFSVTVAIGEAAPKAALAAVSVEKNEITVRLRLEPEAARVVPGSASVALDAPHVAAGMRELPDGAAFTVAGAPERVKGRLKLKVTDGKRTADVEIAFEAVLPVEHLDSLDAGLARAKREGKPVFLEFTGES
ncbi:MAG: hypothetical protein HYY17_04685, partial [Planctomycetes bacterium]|nr:hypothetical protein [Planctomycetota bacterium]